VAKALELIENGFERVVRAAVPMNELKLVARRPYVVRSIRYIVR
jgi:hypothetical protein